MNKPPFSCAILAGGKSKRMGHDKSFMFLHGKPLIQHVVDALHLLELPIIVIANEPDKYASLGLPIYPDLIQGAGSLGGLFTAIDRSLSTYTLCVACDMPFLQSTLLRYMLSLVDNQDYDAAVPRISSFAEPLHAVYRKTCLPAIRRQIDSHKLK